MKNGFRYNATICSPRLSFNCAIHATQQFNMQFNTYYLFFLKTDKDNTVSDYFHEDFVAAHYWFANKLKSLKGFDLKTKEKWWLCQR